MTHDGHVKMSVMLLSLHCLKEGKKTLTLCLFFLSAGNDVKDIFASAKSGDQYRALKIVIKDGKQRSSVLEFVYFYLNVCQGWH